MRSNPSVERDGQKAARASPQALGVIAGSATEERQPSL